MKQKRSLLILMGIFIVTAIAYLGVTKYTEAKAEAEAEAEALLEEESIIYITQLDSESITKVTFCGSVEYTFELVDEVWVYTENTSVEIDNSYITTILSDYCILTAVRELSDGEELEGYGLESPESYVVLTDDEGTETTYYIGNAADDNYYLTIDDKIMVYTVSSTLYTDISYMITDIVVQDTFAVMDSTTMTEVTVVQGDEEISYTSADDGAFDTIATGISGLSFTMCADIDGSDTLESYGLDDESKTVVTIYYEEEVESETTETTEDTDEEAEVETISMEAVLYVGTYIADSAIYYVQVEGSNLVYWMDSATVDSVLNIATEVTE